MTDSTLISKTGHQMSFSRSWRSHEDPSFPVLVDVNIYQGERELINDCRALGQFKLRGIPPMKGGFPLVEVTFRVDANGILSKEIFL